MPEICGSYLKRHMEAHSAVAKRDGFFILWGLVKNALIWLIYASLDVAVSSLEEMWSSDSAIFDKNYIKWIDVEAG